MKPTRFCLPLLLVSLGQNVLAAKSSSKDARVTIIVHDVNLLPNQADARPAAVNDRVAEDTGVRTGDQSRSELTFTDLTITRLGANSVYNYNHAGRSVDLGGGSVLLRVPKDSGGASVRAPAVSVAVTGTIFILEAQRSGRSKLIVLEGGARLALRKYPKQTRNVRAGQMLDVPAGATTLSEPVNIDANQVMKTHPLIVGFPPLPSQGV
ncbi:MAG: FecR family protein, partial [Verrucomicrobiota bacterium]|nr:FecR family protein [Verrucomicrobiota bacterium]